MQAGGESFDVLAQLRQIGIEDPGIAVGIPGGADRDEVVAEQLLLDSDTLRDKRIAGGQRRDGSDLLTLATFEHRHAESLPSTDGEGGDAVLKGQNVGGGEKDWSDTQFD